MHRFTPDDRCPICSGHYRAPRGRGERCAGFLADDGRWAFCTREEYAGQLRPSDTEPPSYRHALEGECPCGCVHGAARERRAAAAAGSGATRRRRERVPSGRIERVYPYQDAEQREVFQVVRFVGKDFRQRTPDGAGGWTWRLNGIERVPYRLPGFLTADPEAIRWVTEGEKDADTLAARGLVATTAPGGTSSRPYWTRAFRDYFRDRVVVVLADNDEPGRDYGAFVADQLVGVAREVKALLLPDLPEKGDVSDWIAKGHTVAELRRLADAAPVWERGGQVAASGADDRPALNAADPDLPRIGGLAWAALARRNSPSPALFRRGGVAVRLERGERERPRLVDLNVDRMRHHLALAARWYEDKVDKRGNKLSEPARPPIDVVRQVLAMPDPPLPDLARIVEAPVFGSGGELLLEPGYHPANRAYYHRPPSGFSLPPVPERPTVDDVARARAILVDELLLDFPFAEQADRAHAVAMLLLPFARDLVDGPTPCHSIESPTQGSGKSLIATVVSLPAMGRHVPALGLPSDEAECAKTLTSVLLDGPAVVLLDNITRAIESPSLARALTTTLYQQRLLGRNETVELPVRCLWLLTANNPTFGADMIRRFVRCRLNPKMDRPFLRETAGFRHPNLTLWAEQHRAELVWAALTLIRAWLAAGRPEFSGRSLGTYEHWAAVMGGILEVAGVPGFLENLTEMYEVADAEGNAWRAIIGEWLDRFGDRSDYEVSAAELLPIVQALGRLALRGDESQQKISLGKQLAAQRERVYAIPAKDESLPARQVCIVNAGTKQRAVRWKLQFLGSDGTSRASIDPETLTHPHHPHRANGEAVGVRVVRVGEGSQPAPRDDEGQDDEPI